MANADCLLPNSHVASSLVIQSNFFSAVTTHDSFKRTVRNRRHRGMPARLPANFSGSAAFPSTEATRLLGQRRSHLSDHLFKRANFGPAFIGTLRYFAIVV